MASNAPQDFGQPFVLEDFIPVEQPVTASSASLCAVCHKVSEQMRRCGSCKNLNYCSKDCQISDWEQHKLLCKAFTKYTSPGSDYRRALFFSPEQPRPLFIWLQYGTNGTPLDMAKCFLNTAKEDIKTIAFHNRFLPYWIQLSYDSNSNSHRNLKNNPAMKNVFLGPVVALAYDAEEGLSKPALDVDTGTLGPALEYARLRAEYAGPIFVEQPQERYMEQEWMTFMKDSANGRS